MDDLHSKFYRIKFLSRLVRGSTFCLFGVTCIQLTFLSGPSLSRTPKALSFRKGSSILLHKDFVGDLPVHIFFKFFPIVGSGSLLDLVYTGC